MLSFNQRSTLLLSKAELQHAHSSWSNRHFFGTVTKVSHVVPRAAEQAVGPATTSRRAGLHGSALSRRCPSVLRAVMLLASNFSSPPRSSVMCTSHTTSALYLPLIIYITFCTSYA